MGIKGWFKRSIVYHAANQNGNALCHAYRMIDHDILVSEDGIPESERKCRTCMNILYGKQGEVMNNVPNSSWQDITQMCKPKTDEEINTENRMSTLKQLIELAGQNGWDLVEQYVSDRSFRIPYIQEKTEYVTLKFRIKR